jgi:hypothetical protein
MEKSFKFESHSVLDGELCVTFDVIVDIKATEPDYADAMSVSVFIENTNMETSLNAFSKEEQEEIERLVTELCEENVNEAYQDYLEYLGDREMDRMEDR